jgi:hypothetical protein
VHAHSGVMHLFLYRGSWEGLSTPPLTDGAELGIALVDISCEIEMAINEKARRNDV